MQIVLRGEIKRTRSKLISEGENKVLRRQIKAQEPRRQVKGSGLIKGEKKVQKVRRER